MNPAQDLWWRQARSDHAVFVHLRVGGFPDCHLLHYFQMATEKLGKAYFWRSNTPPPRSHTGFVRFLKALTDRGSELDRIVAGFGCQRRADFDTWARSILILAYAVQNIAPAEAGEGPNPEYPWPHYAPVACPAEHPFWLWRQLRDTGRGRKLIEFVGLAIEHFDQYA